MLRVLVLGLILATTFYVDSAQAQKQGASRGPQILAMGDSLIAWRHLAGQSIPKMLSRELGEPVRSRAVIGAMMRDVGTEGKVISNQYVDGDWDWVVLNGGGNDLLFGCGCRKCDAVLDRVISKDGSSGEIPNLVRDLRAQGSKVLWIGYLRSPGKGSLIEGCLGVGNEYEARIAKMAEAVDGAYFLSNADLVPYGDGSYHGALAIHPSKKGTQAIAARMAEIIRIADESR